MIVLMSRSFVETEEREEITGATRVQLRKIEDEEAQGQGCACLSEREGTSVLALPRRSCREGHAQSRMKMEAFLRERQGDQAIFDGELLPSSGHSETSNEMTTTPAELSLTSTCNTIG